MYMYIHRERDRERERQRDRERGSRNYLAIATTILDSLRPKPQAASPAPGSYVCLQWGG